MQNTLPHHLLPGPGPSAAPLPLTPTFAWTSLPVPHTALDVTALLGMPTTSCHNRASSLSFLCLELSPRHGGQAGAEFSRAYLLPQCGRQDHLCQPPLHQKRQTNHPFCTLIYLRISGNLRQRGPRWEKQQIRAKKQTRGERRDEGVKLIT